MYTREPRISKKKQKELLKHFALGVPAQKTAELVHVHPNTVYMYFTHYRESIFRHLSRAPRFAGEVEIDETTFGGYRPKKRHPGADPGHYFTQGNRQQVQRPYKNPPKVLVMGIQRRGGDVYTHIIPDRSASVLIPVIHLVVEPGATIYTDEWSSYSKLALSSAIDQDIEVKVSKIKALSETGKKSATRWIAKLEQEIAALESQRYKHVKINHSKKFAERRGEHVNTLERFWGFAKEKIRGYKGGYRHNFPLHLKEIEFRWNHRNDQKEILRVLKTLV